MDAREQARELLDFILSQGTIRYPHKDRKAADRISAALTEAHAAGRREEGERLRGGLEYADEQMRDYGWNCDCRMSGSGGCFEQCPLHAALAEKRRE